MSKEIDLSGGEPSAASDEGAESVNRNQSAHPNHFLRNLRSWALWTLLVACIGCGGVQGDAVAPSKAVADSSSRPSRETATAQTEGERDDAEQPGRRNDVADDRDPSSSEIDDGEPVSDDAAADVGSDGESTDGDATGGEGSEAEQRESDDDSTSDSETEVLGGEAHPFPYRFPVEEFPEGLTWVNTSEPVRLKSLKGKFVLLDFWTYCCINCIHVLPELKKIEQEFPDTLVVIGVHSAKFETEKDSDNIRAAVARYEIEHAVVNDLNHEVWDSFYARSWPTIRLIDPEGMLVAKNDGEFKAEELIPWLRSKLAYYRKKGLLDEQPVKFRLTTPADDRTTPLRFPGKVLADAGGNRLFIADSNHNRIVVTTLSGEWLRTIGQGSVGNRDGDYGEARFHHPQGMVLKDDMLYVADTENHLLRLVDLKAERVRTVAGTGTQARYPWPGIERLTNEDELPQRWVGPPATTALNSPWALWIHAGQLYIAMAGPHQIWKMPLDESEIGPYAGNGREDIVDGPLLPRTPYAQGFSSFAQPSGLTSDGTWLYVADSEGSSIRAVPFDSSGQVRTVVGTSSLEFGRLFEFGDKDGPSDEARLQHPLGVVFHDGKIYVADTYNNKIRAVDATTGETTTVAGRAEPGADDETGTFDEPAGLSIAGDVLYVADTNNHRIRTIDLNSREVGTLRISGLSDRDDDQ